MPLGQSAVRVFYALVDQYNRPFPLELGTGCCTEKRRGVSSKIHALKKALPIVLFCGSG